VSAPTDHPFAFPIVPRYAEIDQQGVVFNGHYLTWFDEACTAFLDGLPLTYEGLLAGGLDFKVVRSEIDYLASVRWRDAVRVLVACERTGTTSFTLAFTVLRAGAGEPEQPAVRGRTTYVVVSTADWAKRPLPDHFRAALERTAAAPCAPPAGRSQ
jgi:acyl-CoA thioester hydrolase